MLKETVNQAPMTQMPSQPGVSDGDTVIWYFIGTHAEHERLLKG